MAFGPPYRSTELIRIPPPRVHLSSLSSAGIKSLYENITKGVPSAKHAPGTFTDAMGYFQPSHDLPKLACRYRYVDVIGNGQSCVFIRAEDTFCDDLQVSIKVLHTNYHMLGAQEGDCIRRLNQEDPYDVSCTVRLLNTFRFDNHFCMVFELLRPEPLTHYFPKQDPNKTQEHLASIRKVTNKLLQALGFLKKQNVIHADLKPENVLCKPESDGFDLKLVDFGNAIRCIHDEVSLYYDDFELQTLLYRAPEVMFGVPFGLEIDMWSLGCMVAECFLGRPLFFGTNKEQILREIVELLGPYPKEIFQRGKFYSELRMFTKRVQQPDATQAIFNHLRPKTKTLTRTFDYSFANFIARCLRYNPAERLTPAQAAKHPFLAKEQAVRFLLEADEDNYPLCPISSQSYQHTPYITKEVKRQHLSTLELLSHGTAPVLQPLQDDSVMPREIKSVPLGQNGHAKNLKIAEVLPVKRETYEMDARLDSRRSVSPDNELAQNSAINGRTEENIALRIIGNQSNESHASNTNNHTSHGGTGNLNEESRASIQNERIPINAPSRDSPPVFRNNTTHGMQEREAVVETVNTRPIPHVTQPQEPLTNVFSNKYIIKTNNPKQSRNRIGIGNIQNMERSSNNQDECIFSGRSTNQGDVIHSLSDSNSQYRDGQQNSDGNLYQNQESSLDSIPSSSDTQHENKSYNSPRQPDGVSYQYDDSSNDSVCGIPKTQGPPLNNSGVKGSAATLRTLKDLMAVIKREQEEVEDEMEQEESICLLSPSHDKIHQTASQHAPHHYHDVKLHRRKPSHDATLHQLEPSHDAALRQLKHSHDATSEQKHSHNASQHLSNSQKAALPRHILSPSRDTVKLHPPPNAIRQYKNKMQAQAIKTEDIEVDDNLSLNLLKRGRTRQTETETKYHVGNVSANTNYKPIYTLKEAVRQYQELKRNSTVSKPKTNVKEECNVDLDEKDSGKKNTISCEKSANPQNSNEEKDDGVHREIIFKKDASKHSTSATEMGHKEVEHSNKSFKQQTPFKMLNKSRKQVLKQNEKLIGWKGNKTGRKKQNKRKEITEQGSRTGKGRAKKMKVEKQSYTTCTSVFAGNEELDKATGVYDLSSSSSEKHPNNEWSRRSRLESPSIVSSETVFNSNKLHVLDNVNRDLKMKNNRVGVKVCRTKYGRVRRHHNWVGVKTPLVQGKKSETFEEDSHSDGGRQKKVVSLKIVSDNAIRTNSKTEKHGTRDIPLKKAENITFKPGNKCYGLDGDCDNDTDGQDAGKSMSIKPERKYKYQKVKNAVLQKKSNVLTLSSPGINHQNKNKKSVAIKRTYQRKNKGALKNCQEDKIQQTTRFGRVITPPKDQGTAHLRKCLPAAQNNYKQETSNSPRNVNGVDTDDFDNHGNHEERSAEKTKRKTTPRGKSLIKRKQSTISDNYEDSMDVESDDDEVNLLGM